MIALPTLWQFVALLGVHWIADFVLQTHWQASNKSKNLIALGRHVGIYTITLCFGAGILFGPFGIGFALVNGALHFATDFFTSKWTSALYAKQDWHNFFVVVGLDQLIHQTTLATTMVWIFS